MEQTVEFTGVDVEKRRMVGENKCGNLEWVPYEGREGRLEESLARPEWDEPLTPKAPTVLSGGEGGAGEESRFTASEKIVAGVGTALLLLFLWGFRRWQWQKTLRQKN